MPSGHMVEGKRLVQTDLVSAPGVALPGSVTRSKLLDLSEPSVFSCVHLFQKCLLTLTMCWLSFYALGIQH